MVNLKTLHISSLAYIMPAFVSLKLNCTGSMLWSNFLGRLMLICIGTMLLFWPSACVFSSVIWLSFGVFGLLACSTQVVLAQSEYCRFRASEWLPENQAKWPNFHMLLLCGKFMVIVLLAVRSNCEFCFLPNTISLLLSLNSQDTWKNVFVTFATNNGCDFLFWKKRQSHTSFSPLHDKVFFTINLLLALLIKKQPLLGLC